MNSSTRHSDAGASGEPEGIRLQKVLAAAGYGSRRRCEELINDGRVSVNGELVIEQGLRVDPLTAIIRIDGERIAVPDGSTVLAMNKPRGVLTAMSDDRGRRCVGDMVTHKDRMFHVGRLDADTDGLLLLTNDGDLAHKLTHPSFGVDKTYVAQVAGVMGTGDVRRLRKGVPLDGINVNVTAARIRDAHSGRSIVELTIHEGRKHVVRRLLDELGFPVITLTRIRFGPIELKSLPMGAIRTLSDDEAALLYDAVDASPASAVNEPPAT